MMIVPLGLEQAPRIPILDEPWRFTWEGIPSNHENFAGLLLQVKKGADSFSMQEIAWFLVGLKESTVYVTGESHPNLYYKHRLFFAGQQKPKIFVSDFDLFWSKFDRSLLQYKLWTRGLLWHSCYEEMQEAREARSRLHKKADGEHRLAGSLS